jgi:hypothetical protein
VLNVKDQALSVHSSRVWNVDSWFCFEFFMLFLFELNNESNLRDDFSV